MPTTASPNGQSAPAAEPTQPDYGTNLRVLLSLVATADKKRLAAEAAVTSLTSKVSKKDKLTARDLALLTQVDEAHKAGQEAKKEIESNLTQLKKATVEPVRQVLQKAPLSITLEGYMFTISTTPNAVNAWMLDMKVDYQPVS